MAEWGCGSASVPQCAIVNTVWHTGGQCGTVDAVWHSVLQSGIVFHSGQTGHSVAEGMGMWQTLGLGHLGQLLHFLSSINCDDGA